MLIVVDVKFIARFLLFTRRRCLMIARESNYVAISSYKARDFLRKASVELLSWKHHEDSADFVGFDKLLGAEEIRARSVVGVDHKVGF